MGWLEDHLREREEAESREFGFIRDNFSYYMFTAWPSYSAGGLYVQNNNAIFIIKSGYIDDVTNALTSLGITEQLVEIVDHSNYKVTLDKSVLIRELKTVDSLRNIVLEKVQSALAKYLSTLTPEELAASTPPVNVNYGNLRTLITFHLPDDIKHDYETLALKKELEEAFAKTKAADDFEHVMNDKNTAVFSVDSVYLLEALKIHPDRVNYLAPQQGLNNSQKQL